MPSLTTNEVCRNLHQGYDAKMTRTSTGVFLNFVEHPNRGRGRWAIPLAMVALLIIFAVLALV